VLQDRHVSSIKTFVPSLPDNEHITNVAIDRLSGYPEINPLR